MAKKLTIGEINWCDLADWFGIKASSISASKKHYLDKLQGYATYEINDKGKVVITEVYRDEYFNQYNYVRDWLVKNVEKGAIINREELAEKLTQDLQKVDPLIADWSAEWYISKVIENQAIRVQKVYIDKNGDIFDDYDNIKVQEFLSKHAREIILGLKNGSINSRNLLEDFENVMQVKMMERCV